MNVDFNVRDVRKIDTDGSTNMYGPRRYLNFNSTYRFDDHSGIEAGVSFPEGTVSHLYVGDA